MPFGVPAANGSCFISLMVPATSLANTGAADPWASKGLLLCGFCGFRAALLALADPGRFAAA